MVRAPLQRMRLKANGLASLDPTIGANFGFNRRSQEDAMCLTL
jgi:hypothetical protein